MAKLKTQFNDLVSYEAPTPTPPLFSEVVNVVAPANGQVNLTQYNYKTIILDITELDDNPSLILTLPLYCVVRFSNSGESDGNLDLILGTAFNGVLGMAISLDNGPVPSICNSGTMNFANVYENNTLIRMNYFIEIHHATQL